MTTCFETGEITGGATSVSVCGWSVRACVWGKSCVFFFSLVMFLASQRLTFMKWCFHVGISCTRTRWFCLGLLARYSPLLGCRGSYSSGVDPVAVRFAVAMFCGWAVPGIRDSWYIVSSQLWVQSVFEKLLSSFHKFYNQARNRFSIQSEIREVIQPSSWPNPTVGMWTQ